VGRHKKFYCIKILRIDAPLKIGRGIFSPFDLILSQKKVRSKKRFSSRKNLEVGRSGLKEKKRT
jgi:hypothetical protein